MTNDQWFEFCRAAVEDLRGVSRACRRGVEREPVIGTGVGGDETTEVDAAAEDAIVARLERLHIEEGLDFHLVSEELGERIYGRSPTLRVVVDPIDGSLNAKRNIPFFSVSIAVAEGSAMGDVFLGFVHDFGSGEEWTATRGGGAWLNGERLGRFGRRTRSRSSLSRRPWRPRRRQGGGVRRVRQAPADHGLTRALAVQPRRGPR